MKNVIIANPRAGSGGVANSIGDIEHVISERFGSCEARLSSAPGGISELVRAAYSDGAERLILVGGDGTANEAVNGLTDSKTGDIFEDAPQIVIVPMGTGSDFSRTIGAGGMGVREVLDVCEARRIDVGKATFKLADGSITRCFLNIASLGVSAEIADRVNKKSKRFGGKIAFAVATVAVLSSWRDRVIRVRVDDILDRELVASTIVVANGRYFGGGMMIAPSALVDDGLFDVVLVEGLGAFNFMLNSRKIYRGEHLAIDGVSVLRGRQVEIFPTDEESLSLVETDGEVPGVAPVKLNILPKALEVLAPWSKSKALLDK